MPLPQDYANGVLFIGRFRPGGKKEITATTGFVVTMDGVRTYPSYVVTAAHVVEGSDDLFVRVRMKDGGFRDEPAPDWVPHGKHDVAVAPFEAPDGHDLISTHVDQFIDAHDALEDYGEIELGDDVYFIGLLGKVAAMTERNVPFVRTGHLGALRQENVPVRRPGESTKWITAHLIDCRSFSGFSGSPCYLQKHRARAVRMEDGRAGINTQYRTLLLGLIAGHFDDWAQARTRNIAPVTGETDVGDEDAYEVTDEITSRVNSGVGYVIPAEFIRETLMKEELVRLREQDEAAADAEATREDEQNAATEDSIGGSDSEFTRFKNLTRKLVNTPKPETEQPKDRAE